MSSEPCVRQNRVVLAVVATVKLLRMRHSRQPARCPRLSRRRGRPERTRLPGEHGISRKATAQGRPSDWLHLYAAVRFSCVCFSRSGPRVPPAPGLPCSLLDKRAKRQSKTRAKCAARTKRHVCDSKCKLEERRCRLILRHCAAKRSKVLSRRDSGLLRCARKDDVARARATLRSRAPDAAQRPCGALQSRGHVAALYRVAFWVAALRRNAWLCSCPGHRRHRLRVIMSGTTC